MVTHRVFRPHLAGRCSTTCARWLAYILLPLLRLGLVSLRGPSVLTKLQEVYSWLIVHSFYNISAAVIRNGGESLGSLHLCVLLRSFLFAWKGNTVKCDGHTYVESHQHGTTKHNHGSTCSTRYDAAAAGCQHIPTRINTVTACRRHTAATLHLF
jgi:hypothetical protein